MAVRRKIKERTGEADVKPPPQVHPAAVWGYNSESELWYLVDSPTRDDLINHAERFGVDQVAETAAELGYGLEELIALIERLDMIDSIRVAKENRRYSRGGKRASAEKRAKKLLNWVEEPTEEVGV